MLALTLFGFPVLGLGCFACVSCCLWFSWQFSLVLDLLVLWFLVVSSFVCGILLVVYGSSFLFGVRGWLLMLFCLLGCDCWYCAASLR